MIFHAGSRGCCDQVKTGAFLDARPIAVLESDRGFQCEIPGFEHLLRRYRYSQCAANAQPPNPWNGGGLKVNGTPLAVPALWRSPYTKIPNGTNGQTVIAASPNFSVSAINFNLGLDYSGTYTGKIKLIYQTLRRDDLRMGFGRLDSRSRLTQLVMRTSERYLADLRGEFLPLVLEFSEE